MVLTLRLPAEVERELQERAEERGMDVTTYVEELVVRDLESNSVLGESSFSEILGPVHDFAREQGHTEDEIGRFVDAELKAYRAERRALSGKARPRR
jgi:hypothetical protein